MADHASPLAAMAGFAAHRRAVVVATVWLGVLTGINLDVGGSFRATILYAIPVAMVAWRSWHLGFVFAAVAILSAKVSGAIPNPGSTDPLWLDGVLSYAKLSIDALVVNAWGRRVRRRAEERNTTTASGRESREQDDQT